MSLPSLAHQSCLVTFTSWWLHWQLVAQRKNVTSSHYKKTTGDAAFHEVSEKDRGRWTVWAAAVESDADKGTNEKDHLQGASKR